MYFGTAVFATAKLRGLDAPGTRNLDAMLSLDALDEGFGIVFGVADDLYGLIGLVFEN